MNKCLSLVHLTSTIGSQSGGSDESTSWSAILTHIHHVNVESMLGKVSGDGISRNGQVKESNTWNAGATQLTG